MIVADEIEQDARTEADAEPMGIRCVSCNCAHFWEVQRTQKRRGYIQRIRACRNCGRKVTTNEKIVGQR